MARSWDHVDITTLIRVKEVEDVETRPIPL